MKRNTDQAFESIRIVGGLLSTKVLQDARRYQLPGQSKEEYSVEPGLTFNEEIGRYWRIAQGRWQEYQQKIEREDISSNQLSQQEWLLPLLTLVLGYEVEDSSRKEIGEREFPLTHTASGGAIPLILCGADYDLDKGDALFGQEGRKRSPMGLAQEYLNAEERCLWSIVCNGRFLRLLRDNPAMTRPAYIEVDFGQLFEEDNYADFATLWLFLHASRLAPNEGQVELCWLEQWREKGHDEGERALDKLRYGVADALRQLGTGFVANPQNSELRRRLSSEELSVDTYFQQILRLVYRFLFMLTAEDRDVLLLPKDYKGVDYTGARELYQKGYSLGLLRDRARFNRHYDNHCDAWQQLLITFQGFAVGQATLAQPALGGLFSADQCEDLETCALENRYLFNALFDLSYFEHNHTLSRINYRDMDTEEFGSVYESLLELIPQLNTDGQWQFSFMGDAEDEASASGHSRKLTGSYYTPDSLVQELIKSALEPVLADRLAENLRQPREAILSIAVCDPACGSGHFLLAAARRLASELAQVDAGTDQPTEQHYRHAIREVVRHCIYGVDLNPMAVELCKAGLWLESIEPGKPLSFLDAHVQNGNALVGVLSKNQLDDGISNDAFKALTGDDKDICRDLAKENKVASRNIAVSLRMITPSLGNLEEMPEDTVEQVIEKNRIYLEAVENHGYGIERLKGDIFTAAYFVEKVIETKGTVATNSHLRIFSEDEKIDSVVHSSVVALARKHRFLHWNLAFPQIFMEREHPGFDVVLGNPPWEVSQFREEEFFSQRATDIAALSGASRKKSVANLEIENPILWKEYLVAKRSVESENVFYRSGGRNDLTAKGKLNLYALFAQLFTQVVSSKGRTGMILPTGIATDDSTKQFFSWLINEKHLCSLYDFENKEKIFKSVHSSQKFCLLTTAGTSEEANFAFFCLAIQDLSDRRRLFKIDAKLLALINPNTRTCPVFRSNTDAELTKKIYSQNDIFIRDKIGNCLEVNAWRASFRQGTHNMSTDSGLFYQEPMPRSLPLYEAKMVNQYDHRFGSYETRGGERGHRVLPETSVKQYNDKNYAPMPFYWIDRLEVSNRISDRWQRQWFLAFKDVTAVTNERTVIASFIPYAGVGHTMPLIFSQEDPILQTCLLANLNCMTLDYIARQKIGGLHLTYGYLKQFPLLHPSDYSQADIDFISHRVIELSYTSYDLKPLARDLGHSGEPFLFSFERRHQLRSELDAYFAKLYGLTREELRYILDPVDVMGENYPSETFRILKTRELRDFGEYRTQRLVLEAWDSIETGQLH